VFSDGAKDMERLLVELVATREALNRRLAEAMAAEPDPQTRSHPSIDAFFAAINKHAAAVIVVLLPAARTRLVDGRTRARAFVQETRRMDLALGQVQAKMRGQAPASRRTWDSVWADVRRELDTLWRLERRMVRDLADHAGENDPDWRVLIEDAEAQARTNRRPQFPRQRPDQRLLRRPDP
jgi:hypothetical protein